MNLLITSTTTTIVLIVTYFSMYPNLINQIRQRGKQIATTSRENHYPFILQTSRNFLPYDAIHSKYGKFS